MNYKQLFEIANKHIKYVSTNAIPINSNTIAAQLNLRIKNSLECQKDYHNTDTPLSNCHAIYALNNGEYTIYYDENYAYRNFAIAHEIAHHLLGHKSEGAIQHHDANLLAAMLVAPENLIHKYKIKNATQLSEICKIPINIAEEYWEDINHNTKYFNIKQSKIMFVTFFSMLIVILTTIFYKVHNTPNIDVSNHISPMPYISTEEEQTVYVSKSGEKYHKSNCRHISNKENLLELSIDTATEMGYEACADCFN